MTLVTESLDNVSSVAMKWLLPVGSATDAADEDGQGPNEVELVTSFNEAPQVTILEPTSGTVLTAGQPVVLEGTSFDQELFTPLACPALSWSSSGMSGGSATGCNPIVTFPAA